MSGCVEGNLPVIQTLRQRDFALLWTAGLISVLGNWALFAALPIFLYEETGSTFLAGILWVVVFLPNVVVSPFAGVLVDRWDRRRVMLVSNGIQAGAMAPLALVSGEAVIAVAFAVLLTDATMAAFASPAESALLPSIVPEERLASANALNVMNDNIGRIAGPLVGALVLGWGGIGAVALLDGATFALAAMLIWLVRVDREEQGAMPDRGLRRGEGRGRTVAVVRVAEADGDGGRSGAAAFRGELGDGVRVVRGSPILSALFLVIALIAFADGPLTAMLAPWVTGSLGGAERFGLFLSFRGVAGIVGSLVVARVATRVRADRLFSLCVLVVGLELLVVAWAANFWVFVALMVATGPAISGINVGITTIVQRETLDAWRGRVFSLVATTWGMLTVVGTIAGSALGEATSPRLVFVLVGLVYAGAGVLAVVTVARMGGAMAVGRRYE